MPKKESSSLFIGETGMFTNFSEWLNEVKKSKFQLLDLHGFEKVSNNKMGIESDTYWVKMHYIKV